MPEMRTDEEAINAAVKDLYARGYPADYHLPDIKETERFINFNTRDGSTNNVNAGYRLRYINQTDPSKSPYWALTVHCFNGNQNYNGFGSLRPSKTYTMSDEERRHQEEQKKLREQEEAKRQKERLEEVKAAQETAQTQIYAKIADARPVDPENGYIKSHGLSEWAKGLPTPASTFGDKLQFVQTAGAFQDRYGNIIVPMYSENDEAVNFQTIYKDEETGKYTKRYLKNVPTKDRFAKITSPDNAKDICYVCEGWATGMAVALNGDKDVLCAMSCGNLPGTVAIAKKSYDKVILIADNDRDFGLSVDEVYSFKESVVSPSIPESEKAARRSGADLIIIPPEPHTDADDYMMHGGNLRTLLEASKYYVRGGTEIEVVRER